MGYRRFVGVVSVFVLAIAASGQEAEKTPLGRMKKDLFYLASDECEGRGPSTKGINLAADYIVKQFADAGLKAGGVKEYFQPFSISGLPVLLEPNRVAFQGKDETVELKIGQSFQVMGNSGKGKVDAPMVFVGYGLQAKQHKYDEYEGIDVAGKVVVALRRTPRWTNEAMPFGGKDKEALGALLKKIATAEANKAMAVILVNDATELPKDDLESFSFLDRATLARVPVVQVTRAAIEPILKSGLGKSLSEIEKAIDEDLMPRSGVLAGWKAEIETTVGRSTLPVKNVVGVVEGNGPLAKEIVIIGAHYDHLGFGDVGSLAKDKGKEKAIHYGADDNASGTTAMIELARRFAGMKDRQGRKLVFMAFSAEERGLLGSKHYTKEPIFPLADTVAMVNIDMVGKLRPDPMSKQDKLQIHGVGTGKGLDQLVDKFNTNSFTLSKSASGNGPSDHMSFNEKKVPVLFFFTGLHNDYHKPSDTPDRINLEGMDKIVDYIEKIVGELASEPQRRPYVEVKGGSPTSGPKGPRLGIAPGYDSEKPGLLVEAVTAGGAGEKGGLKAGDLIIEIGGKNVTNIETYMVAMSEQKAGHEVAIVVVRDQKKLTLKVTPQ